MNKLKIFLVSLITTFSLQAIPTNTPPVTNGGTVVRNGGDALLTYLQSARNIMLESLRLLLADDNANYYCLKGSDDVAKLCKNFLKELGPQILELAATPGPVAFIISDKPLYVKDFTGLQNMVSARTQLSKNGPIEFYRDSVKSMELYELVFLLAHEFQHKALFKGRYISDDEVVDNAAYGRTVIDDLARTVALNAEERGLLPKKNGIKDIFECEIKTPLFETGAQFSIDRLFYKNNASTDYKISLGNSPIEQHLYFNESKTSRLEFRFLISGWGDCGIMNDYKTIQIQVVRGLKTDNGSYDETVVKENFASGSPLCSDTNKSFAMTFEKTSFTCTYVGSSRSLK